MAETEGIAVPLRLCRGDRGVVRRAAEAPGAALAGRGTMKARPKSPPG